MNSDFLQDPSAHEGHRTLRFTVNKKFPDFRIDCYLVKRLHSYSRAFIQRLIRRQLITVNDRLVKPSYDIKEGDEITLQIPIPKKKRVLAQDIPLEVIYEDDYMVVVNKPPNFVVHPAPGHMQGTLVNALLHHCGELSDFHEDEYRPGVVHRLDKDTSGVIVAAKDERLHFALAQQFQAREIEKQYVALVEGSPELDSDTISAPIDRHPRDRERMYVTRSGGKEAETFYEVKERFARFALLAVFPKTGRTHQIRVHLAHIGHPVVCDRLYGKRENLWRSEILYGEHRPDDTEPILTRQALHANSVTFTHPYFNEKMTFTAELYPDIAAAVEELRRCQASCGTLVV